MTKETRTAQIYNYIMSSVIVVFAGLGLPHIVMANPSIEAVTAILAMAICCSVLVWICCSSLHGWTGLIRMPVVIAWVLFGLSTAAIVAVTGIILLYLWLLTAPASQHTKPTRTQYLQILAHHGTTILVLHLVYVIFQGSFPQIDTNTGYLSLGALIAGLVASGFAGIGLRTIAESTTLDKLVRQPDPSISQEVIVAGAGLVVPLLYTEVNVVIFVITIGLVTFQITRQASAKNAVRKMQNRVEEMTTLSNLSTKITSHLSLVGTLESVYIELDKILNTTLIFIALYNDENDTLDYQLVRGDDDSVANQKEELNSGLVEYVIRIDQPICHTRDEVRRIFKNLYDVSDFKDQQYMLAPLKVSSKVIGVVGAFHATDPEAFSSHEFALFQTIANQASLAIRNAMLYDRTVRLADNLSIINQSLQDVMFNLDRQDAMKASCQIAANVTRTTKAAIFLLDTSGGSQMKLIESVGFHDSALSETMPYKPVLFKNGARVITNTSKSTDKDILDQAKTGNFKACVQIPLRSGNTIIGTLNVYHDTPYYYEIPELNLLQMLTNQITAALDNADLLQALELYAAEQAQLVHLSRVSSETLELDSIIKGVCQMLAQMMAVSRVAIGFKHDDKNSLMIHSNDGTSFGITTSEINLDQIPEMERVLDPLRPSSLQLFTQDNHDILSDGLVQYMRDNGNRTLGLMPMRLDEKVIGIIVLGHVSQRHFSDNDMRLLEMANNQITVQIHNARVHTNTEQQLANRLEQLELIEDIAQQISQAMELDIIIQNVLEAALQSTQADFASIALTDPVDDTNFDIIWREVVDDRLIPNHLTIKVTGGVVNHVRQTGEMVIIPDNGAFNHYVSPATQPNTYNSSVAIPMRTGNTVIGVLNLESVKYDFFTAEQATFLNSLAGHAAISLDNANLLVEREQQINTLTLLRELSLEAVSVIQRDDIFKAVARTAVILLNGDESALYAYDKGDSNIQLLTGLQSDNGQMVDFTPSIPAIVLKDAAKEGTVQFYHDVSQSDLFQQNQPDGESGYKSMIIMPLARRQQVTELLCVGFVEKRQFSRNDYDTIDLMSVQIAGHLENAALNEAITTNNDRMRAILDSTRDGIILLDTTGRIQDANSAATYLTGIDLNNYLYNPVTDLAKITTLTPNEIDIWQTITEKYLTEPDSIHNQEFVFEHSDALVYVKMIVTGVVDDEGEIGGRLLILRDITEEKNLQEFQTMMQSMVLHDLRGPLTSIVTSMYVADNILALYDGSDFDDLKDSLLKTFNVSLLSAEDMLRQVDTLRDLPMLSQMQTDPQFLPIYDIAEGAFSSLSANYLESNITVDLDIAPDFNVFVDESLIRRVIINLMHNAFKYTPLDGTVLVRLIPETNKPGYCQIEVADTGPGIPDDYRESIFGRYIQVEGQKPRAGGKGTGLGLNFCKLAVEAHGGEIWVAETGPLSGACFTFTIPTTEWRQGYLPADANQASE